jgi:peptide/nickel transport system substrate-binding protein
MNKKIFALLATLMVFSMIVTACAPETVVETVVVEKEGQTVVETVVVEKEGETVIETVIVEVEAEAEPVEQVLSAALGVGPGGYEDGVPWTGGAGHTTHIKQFVTPTIFNNDLTEIVPYAVESWTANDDFTVWTYKLREDIKWSDGESLTANDWKFTADFVTASDFDSDQLTHRDLAFSSAVGYDESLAGEADELVGVQVIDDYTVEFTLTASNPRHYTSQYRTYILPAHAVDFAPSEQMSTDWYRDSDKMVGSGPFVIDAYEKDAFMSLVKNPNYFEGEPKLDQIVIRFFGGNITSAVLALAANEIDFTYIDPTDIPTLEGLEKEYNIFFNNSSVPVYTDIHYPNVPDFWQDINVRKAILYAIDRKAITEQILLDTHYVIPCPVGFPKAWPEDVEWFDYDPDKALELLAEAGVDPSEISMEWVGHAGYDNLLNNSAMQAVQAYMADIGIEMTYRFVDVPTFRERYTADGEWTFHYRGTGIPIYGANFGRGWSNGGSQGGDFKGYDMTAVGLEDAVAAIDTATNEEDYFAAITDFCKLHNETLPDLALWIGNRYGAAGVDVANFWWQPAAGGGPYVDNSHLWEMLDE